VFVGWIVGWKEAVAEMKRLMVEAAG